MAHDLTLAICAYNAARFIESTLESVIRQTYQNFRLLIIDDCSTDDTVERIRGFFAKDPRPYDLILFKENQGIGYARHFAERHVQTPYMMFLDADDLLRPDAIRKMCERITSDSDLMAVGCYLDYIDAEGKKMGGGLYLGAKDKTEFYAKAAKAKLIFMQPAAIYRRELALSVGGYTIDDYRIEGRRFRDYCEDLDLWTRMSDLYTEGKAIVVIPEVLACYRKSSGLSSSSFLMILKMRYVKQNLLRRRAGESELSYQGFYESLSAREIKRLKGDAKAADLLRNGVFALRRKSLLKGIGMMSQSILLRPGYLLEKLRKNIIKR